MEMGGEEYLCVALRPAFFKEGVIWLTSDTKRGSCSRDVMTSLGVVKKVATAKLIRVSGMVRGAVSARLRFMQFARLCVLMCSILPGLKILRDLAGVNNQFHILRSNQKTVRRHSTLRCARLVLP
jgi:hypothetical protein